jgi:hypothetical protein
LNTVWIVIGLGAAGAIAAALASWRRAGRTVDLGAVSHQWLSEHRLGHGPDSRE